MYDFVKGPVVAGVQFGGKDIIIRRNIDPHVSTSLIQFHDGGGAGSCENYFVDNNDSGTHDAFEDNDPSPWADLVGDHSVPIFPNVFSNFFLPIPSHALRDLTL